jgi:hypothetical protein
MASPSSIIQHYSVVVLRCGTCLANSQQRLISSRSADAQTLCHLNELMEHVERHAARTVRLRLTRPVVSPHGGMFPKRRSLPHLFCSLEDGRLVREGPVAKLAGVAQRPASPVPEVRAFTAQPASRRSAPPDPSIQTIVPLRARCARI